MPDVSNGIFSDYCYNQMWELFKTPEDEVGREVPIERWGGRSPTDCITYVKKVLVYGHDKIGRANVSEKIIKTPLPMGKMLALFLVNEMGWKAHYWNPDVKNKRKGDSEHASSYKDMALAKNSYYDIPISGLIVDYNKQEKSTKTVWLPSAATFPGTPVPIPMPITVSSDNLGIIETLSKVKFAYGMARGGTHTFLFSYGEVFEVHYEEEGAKLYGKKAFKDYNWFSGCLLTPQDSTFNSDPIK